MIKLIKITPEMTRQNIKYILEAELKHKSNVCVIDFENTLLSEIVREIQEVKRDVLSIYAESFEEKIRRIDNTALAEKALASLRATFDLVQQQREKEKKLNRAQRRAKKCK
jgi:hypothetical protein